MIKIRGDIIPNDYKEVYDWLGYDSTCPKDVEDELKNTAGEVVVQINSGGGDVFAGSEIYSMLKDRGNVRIEVLGEAASAASLIAMAGHCCMSPTALMMIHNVSTYAEGDCNEMAHTSETLKEANKAIAAAYCGKTGKSEEEILEMMDQETWLNAKSAKELGFADEVLYSSAPMVAGGLSIPVSLINQTRQTLEARKRLKKLKEGEKDGEEII